MAMVEGIPAIESAPILVAVDHSAASLRALAWAAELASQRGLGLRLVQAVASSEARTPGLGLEAVLEAAQLGLAQGQLAKLAAQLRERVTPVVVSARVGPAARVILEDAAAHPPALLVLGTRGTSDRENVLLGSTARRVIAEAACPVLAVHHGDPLPPRRSWRVLAATDGSGHARRAVRAALELLAPAPAEITLLRVFEPSRQSPADEESDPEGCLDGARRSVDAQLRDEARALTAERVEVRVLLRDGVPQEGIVAAAIELDPDLVALGTRGHGGLARLVLGSTAERVAQLVALPVLVVSRDSALFEGGPAVRQMVSP